MKASLMDMRGNWKVGRVGPSRRRLSQMFLARLGIGNLLSLSLVKKRRLLIDRMENGLGIPLTQVTSLQSSVKSLFTQESKILLNHTR